MPGHLGRSIGRPSLAAFSVLSPEIEMTDKQMPLLWGAILWFAAALLLAARGVFVTRPNELPLALALAFLVPILLFVLGLGLSSRWRALVVSVPPERASGR